MTEWIDVPGYGGRYQVTRDGHIRSVWVRGLSPRDDRDGYPRVSLSLDRKAKLVGLHRIMCITFHGDPPPGNYHAAHHDGDKQNNTPENLYWATPSQNEQDKLRHRGNPQVNKTHCPWNHEYTPENTYLRQGHGRQCRECLRANARKQSRNPKNRPRMNAASRRYRARKKAERQ